MALVQLLFTFLVLADSVIIPREQRAAPKLKTLLSKPAPKDPKSAKAAGAIKPPGKPIQPPPKKEVVAADDSFEIIPDGLSPEVTYCYGDADCDRNEYCSPTEHICIEEPTTCYDDVECPGFQICDDALFRCIDPTPSPTTSGCCAGDTELAAARCNLKEGASECSRMSSCYWIETEYGSDCDWTVPTDDPLAYDPGCCMMANTADPTTLWMEKCTLFGTLYDCLLPTTEYGDSRCAWQPAPTDFDCSQLWPTMPPPAGCCAGTSGVATTQCLAEEDSSRCDRLSGCHWISGEGADCEWKTTAKPWEAGCCQIVFDTPSNADSGWTDLCRSFWNEEECNAPRSTDEYARCFWTPTDEGTDCGDVWPSTTEVVDGGCCAGDSVQSSDRCMSSERNLCDRMSDCHWIEGQYADCSPPSTTNAPGCCYVADATLLGSRWEVICIEMWSESDCVRWTDGDSAGGGYDYKCRWSPQSEGYDCSVLWPTPEPNPGCCAADNSRNADTCLSTDDPRVPLTVSLYGSVL